MKCPTCPDSTLMLADRMGIEIDFCPHCRGVWLDRGELEKLVERSVAVEFAAQPPAPDTSLPPPPPPARDRDDRDDDRYDNRYDGRYDDRDDDSYRRGKKRRKRESFLSEIFDFD
ncbi:MAG TPA: zf-TFIIB domain-containing protein [Acidimicrobiales bacterium]|nr:zf-TFIIB domain-containing protein [Acidimicrobiales bacterium]